MHPDNQVKSTNVNDVVDEQLQGLLKYLMSFPHVKHAIVAVESMDRNFRWYGAAGDANPERTPMQTDTPFNIASIDKMYTASVVMMLFERGLVSLDAPISTYLPQSLVSGIHRLGGVDYSGRITVRHLLSHTSGLPDCLEDRPKGGRSFMEQLFQGDDRAWTIQDLIQIVRDDLTPHFPPQPAELKRQKVRYSDTNFQLLIALIETVLNQPLHQVFENLLFRRLGLRHTYLFGYSQPLESVSEPASIWVEDKPLNIPLALRSFPSVYCTAEDCLSFLRAYVRGEIFSKTETLSMIQNRWNRFGFPLDPVALRSPGWPVEYGLGLMRFQLPRLFSPLHPMPVVIGHTGSPGSWLFHCPELDLMFCGTVDQATAGAVPYRIVPRLLKTLSSFDG